MSRFNCGYSGSMHVGQLQQLQRVLEQSADPRVMQAHRRRGDAELAIICFIAQVRLGQRDASPGCFSDRMIAPTSANISSMFFAVVGSSDGHLLAR